VETTFETSFSLANKPVRQSQTGLPTQNSFTGVSVSPSEKPVRQSRTYAEELNKYQRQSVRARTSLYLLTRERLFLPVAKKNA